MKSHTMHPTRLLFALVATIICDNLALADDPQPPVRETQRPFREIQPDIQPLAQKYCIRCHAGDKPKGELSLTRIEQNDKRRRTASFGPTLSINSSRRKCRRTSLSQRRPSVSS